MQRPNDFLEPSEDQENCEYDKGKTTLKVTKRRRKALKRGRSVPLKSKGTQRKRIRDAVPSLTETPIELVSKDLEQHDHTIDSPPLESIESGEIVTQDVVEAELSASSTSCEDTFLLASEYMNVINKAFEDISKIVPNLRSVFRYILFHVQLKG